MPAVSQKQTNHSTLPRGWWSIATSVSLCMSVCLSVCPLTCVSVIHLSVTSYPRAQYSNILNNLIACCLYAVCVTAGYIMSYWNRPFFPEGCADATLHDPVSYDTMVRIAGSFGGFARAFKVVADMYDWTHIVLDGATCPQWCKQDHFSRIRPRPRDHHCRRPRPIPRPVLPRDHRPRDADQRQKPLLLQCNNNPARQYWQHDWDNEEISTANKPEPLLHLLRLTVNHARK